MNGRGWLHGQQTEAWKWNMVDGASVSCDARFRRGHEDGSFLMGFLIPYAVCNVLFHQHWALS